MDSLVGKRIIKLRTSYKLSPSYFAEACSLSHVTVFKMEKGLLVSEKSLVKIVETYGTTLSWLLSGLGPMLPEGQKDLAIDEIRSSIDLKEDSIQDLKKKAELLEMEIDRLWEILAKMIQGKAEPG